MSEETADLLAGTREYIEKNGWWRGALVGPNGKQVCLLGALVRSMGLGDETSVYRDPKGMLAIHAIHGVLKQRFGPFGIPEWNDNCDIGAKNKQDVLDVLAKAEKIERAGFDPDAA